MTRVLRCFWARCFLGLAVLSAVAVVAVMAAVVLPAPSAAQQTVSQPPSQASGQASGQTSGQTSGQAAGQASGQTLPSNIGVIDMNQVLQKSEGFAKVRAALDQKSQEFQTSIAEDELRLRNEERVLNSSKERLDEAEFAERYAQFEKDVVQLQQLIQRQQIRFDRSTQQAHATLEQELLKIVGTIAEERQLSMVLQRSNVVIFDRATDITGEALQRLNERTKNLKVTLQDEGQ